jgi:hypothetical protein
VEDASNQCPASTSAYCVDIVYASGNLIVLEGETIPEVQINLRSSNHIIWQAVNQIKAQGGFNVVDVAVSGSGLEVNPFVYHVVMSK